MIIFQPSVSLGDPHICSDAKNRLNILTAIFDTLIRRDLDGVFVAQLATNWRVDADACTWTFTLRDDVLFHNGDRLSSADVTTSLHRACDPSVGGELGTEGVWASYLGDATIMATDKHTIQIVTARPMADLLELLCAIPIMPQRVLPDVPTVFIGSGPYQLVSRDNDEVTLHAFPACRTRTAAYPVLRWIAEPDEEKRITALQTGDADLITNLSPANANRQHTITQQSNLCVAFLINCKAISDRRVRQALNYAVNVERLIEQAVDGAAMVLNGPLTPLHFGCDPDVEPFGYDPEKARGLLDSAEFNRKLIIDLPTSLPDEAPLLGKLLAEDFTAVGLEVELRHYEDRTAYAHMVKDKRIHDLCCFDSSPLSTYRVLREKINSDVAGPWWQQYDNPAVNALLDKASRTADDVERQSIYYAAYRMMSEDAPWVFLYRPTLFWGTRETDHNVQVSPEGLLRIEKID